MDSSSANTAVSHAESGCGVALREHSNANLLKIDTRDKYSTVSAIKKLIEKEMLPPQGNASPGPLLKGMQRINKNPKTPYLFMAFETEQDRDAASAVLQKITHRGIPWTEVPVTPRDLQLTHKGGKKRPREEGSKLTEYETYTMEEQHERKKAHCLAIMKTILPPHLYGWEAHTARFGGIVSSPQLVGYRNHVNLSFGYTADGIPTLGFLQGALVEGVSSVLPAVDPVSVVITMSPLAKVVAVALMDVCRMFFPESKGGLQVFDKVKGTGFWRRLQVRHNVHGEVMLDIEMDVASVPPPVFEDLKRELVTVYTSEDLHTKLKQASALETAAVVSLQYHAHSGISSVPQDAPRYTLAGAATLTEHLCGLQFELSPTSFFQVNTPAMECMLDKVQEVAALTPTTTLLDLCSGTGTIGLSLAHHVRRVIGIEMVESAVINAQRNAERNGISNVTFHCGRVEQLLPDVINNLSIEERQDIVAIVDPPRAGVSSSVLKWIRGTWTIRRVVYISCEQTALTRDCPCLTKPATKAYRCTPFEVTAGFAVDMFPHTHHVEMVAVLTRLAAEKEESEEKGDAADGPSCKR